MKLALQSEMAITNDDVRQLDRSYVFPFMVDAGQPQSDGDRWRKRL